MAKIEGIQPGVTYTLDEFILKPGTGPLKTAPNTANPKNPEFNLDISVKHGPDFITGPYATANMETVCQNYEEAMAYAAAGILPVFSQFRPLEERVQIVRQMNKSTIDKVNYPHAVTRADGRPLFMMGVGYKNAVEQSKKLALAGAPGIRLDTPNGYTPGFNRTVREIDQFRLNYEDNIKKIRDFTADPLVLWAGNVATPEGIYRLADAGADGVLDGIGSGSGCGTAYFIGVHVPQATALIECQQAAEENDITLVSDGGTRNPWIAGNALAMADMVMMGAAIAGTHESPADKRPDGSAAFYYGSASLYGRRRRADKYPDLYTFNEDDPTEGFSGWIPVQGSVHEVIGLYRNTLYEQLYYVGASNLEDFHRYAVLQYMSMGAQKEVQKGFVRNGN